MGNWNSGRRPQSTAVRVLRGNPSKVRLPDDEPQLTAPADAFDAPPAELAGDTVALAEWARVVPLLRRARVITDGDRSVLIGLCTSWSTWLDAQQRVRRDGMIVPGPKGMPVRNLNLRIAGDAMKECIRLWCELGLTPSSRTRLTAVRAAEMPPVSKWGSDL